MSLITPHQPLYFRSVSLVKRKVVKRFCQSSWFSKWKLLHHCEKEDNIFDACGRAKLNQNPACRQELQIRLKKGPKNGLKKRSQSIKFSFPRRTPPSCFVLTYAVTYSAGPIQFCFRRACHDIRDSVDSRCRDGADAQYMQYLSKSRITSPQTR